MASNAKPIRFTLMDDEDFACANEQTVKRQTMAMKKTVGFIQWFKKANKNWFRGNVYEKLSQPKHTQRQQSFWQTKQFQERWKQTQQRETRKEVATTIAEIFENKTATESSKATVSKRKFNVDF